MHKEAQKEWKLWLVLLIGGLAIIAATGAASLTLNSALAATLGCVFGALSFALASRGRAERSSVLLVLGFCISPVPWIMASLFLFQWDDLYAQARLFAFAGMCGFAVVPIALVIGYRATRTGRPIDANDA